MKLLVLPTTFLLGALATSFAPAMAQSATNSAAANSTVVHSGRIVVGSSVPREVIEDAPSFTTVDAFGNRTTTRIATPQSAAQTIARQGIYGTNQASRRTNTTVIVPCPVPVYGAPVYGQPVYGQPVYGAPVYGQPVYVPYPVPQNTIQHAPLGPSYFGWDKPATVTSIPLGTRYNYYPTPTYGAPVYGQPVYGQPVYGQPVYGAPYAGYCPPTYGHTQQSGASFSVGTGGVSFGFYSSTRR